MNQRGPNYEIMLFDLIKSLSKTEKRHFSLYASRQKEKPLYLDLFKIIDSKGLCTDEDLLNELKKTNSTFRHLAYHKHILFEEILKSLTLFHSKKRVAFRINRIIESIDIAFHKGLYELAGSLISKGLNLSMENERYTEIIVLLDWKEELARSTLQGNELIRAFKEVRDLRMQTISRLNDLAIVNERLDEALILRRTFKPTVGCNDLQNYNSTAGNSGTGALTGKFADCLRFRTDSLLAFSEKDYLRALELEMQIQEIYLRSWKWALDSPWRVAINGYNLGLASLALNDSKGVTMSLAYLDKLINSEHLGSEYLYLKMYKNLWIRNAIINEDWSAGLQELARIESCGVWKKGLGSALWDLELMYFRAYIHFLSGNFLEASGSIRELLKGDSLGNFTALMVNTRLIQMLVAWRLDDFDIAMNVYSMLRRQKDIGHIWNEPEGLLMETINRICKEGYASDGRSAGFKFENLYAVINKMTPKMNPYFDIQQFLSNTLDIKLSYA